MKSTALKKINLSVLVLSALLAISTQAAPQPAQSISSHGITWNFDKPYPSGAFITGDPWVLGPVKVVSVKPAPGPFTEESGGEGLENIYGDVAMVDDKRMQNGSMIILQPGPKQGYDSRLKNYDPAFSVEFPIQIDVDRSLISTISNQTLPVPQLHNAIMWASEKNSTLALKSASVLTVLKEAPPADAFRPPYIGKEKPIFRASQIQWDLLPNLKTVASTPEWSQFERYFERSWLDHQASWMHQHTGPSENQANYGREFSRLTSIASLMLMLDVPKAQKEKLMIGLLQLGIDLNGLAQNGRKWSADGGHWNGRKWPVLFAAVMLGDERLQRLPDTVLFSEDQQMYYGKGWLGQPALYQIVTHTGPKPPHEEKSPDQWDANNKRAESYRMTVSGGLPGTALAVQLMKAKAAWNHDAFFDYYDRWMSKEDVYAEKRGEFARPKQEGKSIDLFVDEMWDAYRTKVPNQAGGNRNRKWVWNVDSKAGEFINNPKAP